MLRDSQCGVTPIRTGAARRPHGRPAPISPAAGLQGPSAIGSSLYKDSPGRAARLGDSRRWDDAWFMQPRSPKWIFSPPSRNKCPGPQPTAQGQETCFKICACHPVAIRAQANSLPLGRTALLINHASGKCVVCPRAHSAVTKPVWKCLSVNGKHNSLPSMSTAGGPRWGFI